MLSNNLFESFLDYVPFSAYIIDIKTAEVIYVNKWAKKDLQESENEYIYTNKIRKFEENLEDSYEFFDEVRDRWFVCHDKYMLWFDGRRVKYTILVDITEQKENQGKLIQNHTKLSIYKKDLEKIVEEQLLKLRKQDQLLLVYQKQNSLDNIMSLISHQWKQPLHELSINNIYLSEKNKSIKLKKIYEENDEIIQFLSSTINTFRNFYKPSISKTFFVIQSVKETLLILNSVLRNYYITVDFIYEDENIEINGEKNIFTQAILTILENAISILIEREIEQPLIKIEIKILKNRLIFNIEDNAGGINESNLPYIFENSKSFRKNESSGLGLYISKLIIMEKFRGDIYAKNGEKGAIFTINIPFNNK